MTTDHLNNEIWTDIAQKVWANRQKSEMDDVQKAEERAKIQDYWMDQCVPRRFENCMVNEGIRDLHHLSQMRAEDLMLIPNFGKITLRQARELLASHGMALSGESLEPANATPKTEAAALPSTGLLPVHVIMAAYVLREAGWTVIPPSTLQATGPVAAPAQQPGA